MVVVDSEKRISAKTALRQVLAACGGNTKDEAVIAAINHLCQLNPTTAAIQN